MNDLIDRRWAIASAISGRVMILPTSEGCEEKWIRTKEVRQSLLDVPSVSMPPARPKGKWIDKPDPYNFFCTIPVCSECDHFTKYREKTSFCPNCGADMREDADG